MLRLLYSLNIQGNRTIFRLTYLLCCLCSFSLIAQNNQDSILNESSGSVEVTKGEVDTLRVNFINYGLSERVFRTNKFLNQNPENFIENFSHEAYVQNETAGDFSRPDDYAISINGASFKWNRYKWNGFAIHSLSNPGASLHKIDLNQGHMSLGTRDFSLNFSDPIHRDSSFVRLRGQYSPFFDLIPNASGIASGITGHKSSFDRKIVDFDYRRHTDHQMSVYINLVEKESVGEYSQLYFNKGKRYHTSFDKLGLSGEFDEDYFQLNASNAKNLSSKYFYRWYNMLSVKSRDAYQAEWNYEEQETAKEDQLNFSSYVVGSESDWDYKVGVNFGLRNIDRSQGSFYRNMYDIDGEGFEPLYPLAQYVEVNPVIQINKRFKGADNVFLSNSSLFGEFENGLIHFNPNQTSMESYYYFDPVNGDKHSLYQYDLSSKSFSSQIANNQVGMNWRQEKNKSIYYASVAAHHSGVWSPHVAITDFSLDMDLGWETKIRSNVSFGISLAKRSIPLNYSLIQYLEKDYLDGEQNIWKDLNGNGTFESGEATGLFRNYGASNRSYSSNLKMNKVFSLEIPVKWQMTKGSRLELMGRFSSFRDLWWVSYDKPASEYGHFEEVIIEEEYFDSDEVFFLDNSDVAYVLNPFDTDLMSKNIENDHPLFEYPFYAGATLTYYYEGEDVFMKTSFTAYEVVGPGILGNGAQANSLGLISDNMANPNANIHVLGRLNPDRSYLFNFFIGHKVSDKFNYGVVVNYKDGQSFNGYNTAYRNDQLAIWNHGIPGDNPFTGEFNKREDGFWNIELRAEYATKWKGHALTIHSEIYNFFDLGWEINEYTFSPYLESQRPALDIQIPRGLIFGIDLSL